MPLKDILELEKVLLYFQAKAQEIELGRCFLKETLELESVFAFPGHGSGHRVRNALVPVGASGSLCGAFGRLFVPIWGDFIIRRNSRERNSEQWLATQFNK